MTAARRSSSPGKRALFGPLVAALALALLLLAAPGEAEAHEVGISRGDYHLVGANVTAEIVLSRNEVVSAAPTLDLDEDGTLTEAEVKKGHDLLENGFAAQIVITADGATCPPKLREVTLTEQDGLDLHVTYECPKRPAKLDFYFPLLSDLSGSHRHVAHVEAGGEPVDRVVFRRDSRFEVSVGPEAAAESERGVGDIASSFFVSGVEHILTGVDHLVFLFGLVLLGGKWRSILLMVTAFTVAHSITLGLSVMGIWAPSPSIIEPAIALSVAYVGVENLFVKSGEKRWRITFPFGLLHGFGFASALGVVHLPAAQLPVALLTFNLGVEAGQVASLAVVLPLVLYARKSARFRDVGVKALSALIAAAGVIWFVTRAFF